MRWFWPSIIGIYVLGSAVNLLAQQVPDKKDYALAALEGQRNEAWNREARCQAEFQFMIDDLNRQIADLKKQLAEKEK